jgi:RNA polymerase II-associated protein 2
MPSEQSARPRTDPSRRNSREKQNRDLALYHARLVKQQAQSEARILEATETLLEFPLEGVDPMHPSKHDADQVKALLQPFQPTDYDALIQERNIDGRCGYVLCPRPQRSEGTTAKYRIVKDKDLGHGAFKVVDRADLEKWCSDICGKCALYLRLQLSETPAWERRAGHHSQLELYDDKDEDSTKQPEKTDVRTLVQDLGKLALERGDKGSGSFRSDTLQVNLMEKSSDEAPQAPLKPEDHSAVDGYVSGRAHGLAANFNRLKLDSDDDDIMDTI